MMWVLLVVMLVFAGLCWWGVVASQERARAARRRRVGLGRVHDDGPLVAGRHGHDRHHHHQQRQHGVERYEVPVGGERLPLRGDDDGRGSPAGADDDTDWDDDFAAPPMTTRLLDELRAELRESDGAGSGDGGEGRRRVVMTVDGPVEWSEPPFRAAGVLFAGREARVLSAVCGRLPGGFVLAGGVRLDALLEPVRPSDGSFETWRTWRERVRRRSVSGVICHAGSWRPVLCVLVVEPVKATSLGGGRDRITTEALQAAGVAFVEIEGELDADWGRIEAVLREARGVMGGRDVHDAGGFDAAGRARGSDVAGGLNGVGSDIPPESAGAMFSMLDDDESAGGLGGGGGGGGGDRYAERRA